MKNIIGVIGLGYVGLPLAIAFGKLFPTIGFDTNSSSIKELQKKIERTNEDSIDVNLYNCLLTVSGSTFLFKSNTTLTPL